jgi:acylglycerol lipase
VANPTAIVFLCHGYGEHIGRYEHVALAMNKLGLSVYGLDHQGCGQSDGARAYVESFQHFVDDYLRFVRARLEQGPLCHAVPGFAQLPRFLLGHSMGGAIATLVAQQDPSLWAGVVLSAPAILPNPKTTPAILIKATSVLKRLAPKLSLERSVPSRVSSSPQVVERYRLDPLNSKWWFCAGVGHELLGAMSAIRAALPTVEWPFLLLQGTEDQLVYPDGAILFHKQAASADKTLQLIPGAQHEVMNEPNSEEVINMVTAWIQERIPDPR